ncbi:response regulator transcription factor [Thiomicrorhabdus arctica]|jgi:FixJ family two-component response regulator|uniref:response regulator transcription factor n=1 Tax=Thiomicrorhabdus arctica TaxID=131540 RepID=UPI000381EF9E|nr:response regulator [Thiomicrorhabdus arctica]
MEICVYVVDDDQQVRESLQWLLDSVNITTQLFKSGQAFLDTFSAGLPGCVILDVRMPDINGMDLHRLIKKVDQHFPVIIVTGHADVPMALRAMKEGAFDFIEKPYNDQHLLERIQVAIQQHSAAQKEQKKHKTLTTLFSQLSKREKQVLDGVLQGKSNNSIAEMLYISVKTIEVHRANLMSKLNVKTVSELVRLAIEADHDRITPPQ